MGEDHGDIGDKDYVTVGTLTHIAGMAGVETFGQFDPTAAPRFTYLSAAGNSDAPVAEFGFFHQDDATIPVPATFDIGWDNAGGTVFLYWTGSDQFCFAEAGSVEVDRYESVGGKISGTLTVTAGSTGGDDPCPEFPVTGSFRFTRHADVTPGSPGTGLGTFIQANRTVAGGTTADFPDSTRMDDLPGQAIEGRVTIEDGLVFTTIQRAAGSRSFRIRFLSALELGTAEARFIEQFDAIPATPNYDVTCQATGTVEVLGVDAETDLITGRFTGGDMAGSDPACPVTAYDVEFLVLEGMQSGDGTAGQGPGTMTMDRTFEDAPTAEFPAASAHTVAVFDDVEIFARVDEAEGPSPATRVELRAPLPDGALRRALVLIEGAPAVGGPFAAQLIEAVDPDPSTPTGGIRCDIGGTATFTQAGGPGELIVGEFTGNDTSASHEDCPVSAYAAQFKAWRLDVDP